MSLFLSYNANTENETDFKTHFIYLMSHSAIVRQGDMGKGHDNQLMSHLDTSKQGESTRKRHETVMNHPHKDRREQEVISHTQNCTLISLASNHFCSYARAVLSALSSPSYSSS